ncbi:hypothetical protein K439DRAFT_1628400, partial [Ramaria rubella]
MVWTVWALETAHTVISWYLLYSLTVINYGQFYKIEEKRWTYLAGFPLAACIGSIVQAYFVYRVRVLSKKLFIPVIAWGAVILRCGFGVAIAVVAMVVDVLTISSFLEHYRWIVLAPLTINLCIDVVTTSTSCFYLVRQNNGSQKTRKVVDRLVRYTVETGLITSLCAAGVLACVLLVPNTLLHLSIFNVYPKLFSNSLLTSLNARHSLRKTFSGPVLTLNSDV